MKYTVTYRCGHTGVIDLGGKGSEREWRLKKEAEKLCPDCYQEELDRKNKEAAEKAEQMGIPKLEGSEKQIAWAESIRSEIISKIDEVFYTDSHSKLKGSQIADTFKSEVMTCTSAKIFIESRGSVEGNMYSTIIDYYRAVEANTADEWIKQTKATLYSNAMRKYIAAQAQ